MKDQKKKELEEKQSDIEHWLKANLGLQQLSYNAHASFRRMILALVTFIIWSSSFYLKTRRNEEDEYDYMQVLHHVFIILFCEAALYLLQKINFKQLINLIDNNSNWSLQLKLLDELYAGKYLPMYEAEDELRAVLAVGESLANTSGRFMRLSTGLNFLGAIILGLLILYRMMFLKIDPYDYASTCLLLIYSKKNRNIFLQYIHSHGVLTQQQKENALEGLTSALRKIAAKAVTSQWCTATNRHTLSVILKFERLSSSDLLMLLATNTIDARVQEGQMYCLVMNIPTEKIKSKLYSQYLDDVFTKARNTSDRLGIILKQIGALPEGWLLPHKHHKRYDHLLVEENYFDDRNDFDKSKFLLEDGFYMIPLLDNEFSQVIKDIKPWTRAPRIRIVEEKPDPSTTQLLTDRPIFYGNVVSPNVVRPICNKYRIKHNLNSAPKAIPVHKPAAREINWGFSAGSVYLDETQYTLLPLETTKGNQVVISHIWAAIPTEDIAKFEKYLFLLGDEWNAGYGIKRFEANTDTGCYKTHDKSDDRYLLMPVQFGEYVGGSLSSDSRPLLLRLHTEKSFSHRDLEGGIPNQQLRNEFAEFKQNSAASRRDYKH